MKKLIKLFVLILTISLFITSCSKLRKFKCAYCGEKFTEIGYYCDNNSLADMNNPPALQYSCKSKELTGDDTKTTYYCSMKCCCETNSARNCQ